VVDTFLAAGFDVVVVDDLSTGRRENLNPAATFYEVDIRDLGLATVFEQERPAYVSHHAAQIEVRKSVADPLFDAQVNVVGSLNVLENARKFGVERVVYASTGGAVYGEPLYLPCDEAHPVAPLSPYGASKYVVEKYLYMYQQNHGLEYTVLRYANVYGPRQNPQGEAGVIAIFAYQMLRGGQTIINGDGDQKRDFVYVGDVVRASLAAVQGGVTGVFNIGAGLGTSINEIYDRLAEVTAYPGRKRHGPAKVGETRRIYLDVKQAGRALGWQPAVALADGLARTVDYFRDSS